MKSQFVKYGNGLALGIPSRFARQLGVVEGRNAEMTIERDALIVRMGPPKKRRRCVLEQLIERIDEHNRHGEND